MAKELPNHLWIDQHNEMVIKGDTRRGVLVTMADQWPLAVFSTRGGKFHIPADPIITRDQGWSPRATLCGLVLTPCNVFPTLEEANLYTGRRLQKFLCAHCAAKVED